MRVIILLFIVIFLSFTSVYSQDCNCEQAFQKLIAKVETEYPGFVDKTKDKFSYNSFKENLLTESKKSVDSVCIDVLKKYISFFKDPHLTVASNKVADISTTNAPLESVKIDIENFQQKIQNTKDNFEGIWSNESYKIGIKKTNENEYVGFIIESKSNLWKPQEIKFKLLANNEFEYFMLDHSLNKGRYKLHDDSILYLDQVNVAFVKQSPQPKLNAKQIEAKLDEVEGFFFKRLTSKTSILKLPSFEHQNLKRIDKLIEQNKSLLEKSENLIVDIRDNPGGTTDAYQKLLPYVSGKYIRQTAVEFLATQSYVNHLENFKKGLDKNTSTEGIDKQIKLLKDNIGKFVSFSKTGESVVEKIELARKSPKKIVFLANKGVGSSAENFLFIAKQSQKVKILGTPSFGGLDYASSYWSSFGCGDYQVFMPTYRALRLPDYPIDNIGIQPDVYLDSNVKDWVEYALKYLEN